MEYESRANVTKDQLVAEVVTAIAAAEGVDPVELSPPLNDVVDISALAALIVNSDEETSAVFQYRRWEIEVRGDQSVEVRDRSNVE